MDPAAFPPMYLFNTWANEGLRAALTGVSIDYLRRPLGLFFNSAFDVLAHICASEYSWLARLRDGENPPRLLNGDDFISVAELLELWRELDAQWEAYVADLSAPALDEIVTWESQRGGAFSHVRWQLVMHVAFHGSEHRAHAGAALTKLGLQHGPQDFHFQFMPEVAVQMALSRPPRV